MNTRTGHIRIGRTAPVGGLAFLAAVAGVCLTAGQAAAQKIELPSGVAEVPSEPLAKPGAAGRVEWKVVLVNEPAILYADGAGRTRLPEPAASAKVGFGDVFHVMAETKTGRRRYLLAKFSTDRKFRKWVGWVDREWTLDRGSPMDVMEAREYLMGILPEGDPRRVRVENEMPVAAREDFHNVTLKCVTHPERGKYCFVRPVLPDKEQDAIKAKAGMPLLPFSFFYVYKVVVLPENLYCLVGSRPSLDLVSATEDTNFKGGLHGWIEMGNLTLWTTREAFEYNLAEAARNARKTAKSPIELFRTRSQLGDILKARAAGSPPRDTGAVFTEDFSADFMIAPWKPNMMRYPILDRYPLPPVGLPADAPPSGYQLCVLGSLDGGKLQLDPREFEKLKSKVNDAIKNLRIFELVLVVDRTGSMDPLFPVLREAITKLVRELRAGEEKEKIPELERIVLRVGVVGFWDFAAHDPTGLTPRLVDSSGKFFDVSSEKELRDFETYMRRLTANGGGDILEEPFEGIRMAVEEFLSDRAGSRHAKGAARMVVLLSDHGNHDKKAGSPTRLDTDDVLKLLLSPERGGDKRNPVVFGGIRAVFNKGSTCEAWNKQMPALANGTNGFLAEVDLSPQAKAGASTAAINTILKELSTVVSARRSLLRQEIDAVRRMFVRGGDAELDKLPITPFAKARLEQTIPADELSQIQKSLAGFFFTNVHAVERLKDEPPGQPRLQLSVLLTLQELTDIQVACDSLANELREHLAQINADANLPQAVFKDIIVRTLLTVMGNQAQVPPSKVKELREKPLEEIQKMVNGLPVVFGCLKGEGPKTRRDIEALADKLGSVAAEMKGIVALNKERFFDPGVGAGELHIWIRPDELP